MLEEAAVQGCEVVRRSRQQGLLHRLAVGVAVGGAPRPRATLRTCQTWSVHRCCRDARYSRPWLCSMSTPASPASSEQLGVLVELGALTGVRVSVRDFRRWLSRGGGTENRDRPSEDTFSDGS